MSPLDAELDSGTLRIRRPQLARAKVLRAPTAVNETLAVYLVNYSREYEYEVPADHWKSDGSDLPQVDDTCIVGFDDDGDVWVVRWSKLAVDSGGAGPHTHTFADILGTGFTGGQVPVWDDVVSGWDAMTPAAAAHVHPIADVTGLQAALDGKSALGHGHVITDVTDLQLVLDTKQDASTAATDAELAAHTGDTALDGGPHGLPALTADGQAWVRVGGALVAVDVATQAELDAAILSATGGAQPADPTLAALAALVGSANKLAYFNGSESMALTDLTAYARTLLDDPDAPTALSTLGVSTFAKTILDDADAAAVRATIGAAPTAHTHAQADVTNLVTDLAAKQPSDADLTAIAALSTTAYGRDFLTRADAAAARAYTGAASEATRAASGAGIVVHGAVAGTARPTGYASVIWIGSVDPTNSDDALDIWIDTTDFGATYQPLDADLTSIAALATTPFGRSLLTQADALTARQTLGIVPNTVTTLTQAAPALPGSPANNDVVLYFDTVLGFHWTLRYRTAQAAWFFEGGAPAMHTVDTLETLANTAYSDLTTLGPDYTVPWAGDYDIRIEASMSNNTVNDGTRMSFAAGAAAAIDADAILLSVPPVNLDAQLSGQRRKTGLAAGALLRSKYRTITGGTGTFRFRRMIVTPVKVT